MKRLRRSWRWATAGLPEGFWDRVIVASLVYWFVWVLLMHSLGGNLWN